MRKHNYAAISLIAILMLSYVPLTPRIYTVKAYGYDYNYGQASNLYGTNWCQWNSSVVQNTSDALSEIYGLFEDQTFYYYEYYGGPLLYEFPIYGQLENWGNTTTESTVLGRIDSDNNYHWFSAVLYVGHGGPDCFFGYSTNPNNPNDTEHIDKVYYSNIIGHAIDAPSQQFVFMWVCFGANYMLDNYPPVVSEWGSPYAWNPLFWSESISPADYCWIGFYDASPWLSDPMGTYGEYGGANIFKYWLDFFYYFALSGDNFNGGCHSIRQALDLASQATSFEDFGDCILATGYNVTWPYTNETGTGHIEVAGGDPNYIYLPTTLVFWD